MSHIAEGPCQSRGWNEAILSVLDLGAAERLYTEAAGWEALARLAGSHRQAHSRVRQEAGCWLPGVTSAHPQQLEHAVL